MKLTKHKNFTHPRSTNSPKFMREMESGDDFLEGFDFKESGLQPKHYKEISNYAIL